MTINQIAHIVSWIALSAMLAIIGEMNNMIGDLQKELDVVRSHREMRFTMKPEVYILSESNRIVTKLVTEDARPELKGELGE